MSEPTKKSIMAKLQRVLDEPERYSHVPAGWIEPKMIKDIFNREWEHRLGLVMIRELQQQLARAERLLIDCRGRDYATIDANKVEFDCVNCNSIDCVDCKG